MYSTDLPGIEEAVRDAIVDLIKASIPSLNLALAQGGLTPVQFHADQVVLGDSMALNASRISVVSGGDEDVRTMLTEAKYLPLTTTSGYREEIPTNIYVYLHPDELTGDDPDVQAAQRNRALDRITDHLRKRVFHDPANVNIQLASKEHNPAGDILHTSQIVQINKSTTMKNYGGAEEVYCARLAHSGIVE